MQTKRLSAATYGHLSIDIVNASVAMILVAVTSQFNLSISQIGFAALMYQIFAAMSQPLFGTLTDRLRGRWIGAIGLLWTLIFYSLATTMSSYPLFLACLMLGGLGSGAFHAAGLLNASLSGGQRPTMATSIFFLGGQSGIALGPILAGVVLQRWGLAGIPFIALAMTPAVVMMFLHMNDPLPIEPKVVHSSPDEARDARRQGAAAIIVIAFFMLIAFRSGTAQTFSTLLPKFYDTLGYSPATYGFMIGLFSLAGALGTFAGGFMGDRFNRRVVIVTVTVLSVPFSYLMLNSTGWAFAIAAILAGVLLSIPHSIILVMAQELAPNRRGLVGGLVLGFMFASGSTIAWLASIAADRTDLITVMSVVAFMPLLAAACALLLPPTRKTQPVMVRTAPAAAD